jgi:predicted ferric reductase
LSSVVVVAIFIADDGSSYFLHPAEIPTGLGIVSGLVGSNLVLIMLVQAARVPVIDHAIGYDHAMRLHKKWGQPALILLLAHCGLLLWGYGLGLALDPLALTQWFFTASEMVFAYVALGLLALVAATSLVIVRHRLTYRLWFVLHLLTYFAVVAGIPHQFSEGQLFAEGRGARWYWALLYVAALASLVIFRFAVPLARNLRHRFRVIAVHPEGPGVASIVIGGRNLQALRVRGGQFFIWRFGAAGLRWEGHPYSLSAAPGTVAGGALRITVRDLGDGSKKLLGVKPGTRVWAEGPYGLFTTSARTRPKAVLIGGGIGITPLCALAPELGREVDKLTVILRADEEAELYLRPEFSAMAAAGSLTLHELVGPPSPVGNSWLTEGEVIKRTTIETLVPDIHESDVFVCGPARWADFVLKDLELSGVPPESIHVERFDW